MNCHAAEHPAWDGDCFRKPDANSGRTVTRDGIEPGPPDCCAKGLDLALGCRVAEPTDDPACDVVVSRYGELRPLFADYGIRSSH